MPLNPLGRYTPKLLLAGILLMALVSSALMYAREIPDAVDLEDPGTSEAVAELVVGIIHYSRWPDGLKDLELCVLGDAQYATALLAAEYQVGDYSIRSRQLPDLIPATLLGCQIVYIAPMTAADDIDRLYAKLYGSAILTIDEQNDACRVGSMFCFQIFPGERPGFKVNLDAVARSQLRVHPGVLRLGQRRIEE